MMIINVGELGGWGIFSYFCGLKSVNRAMMMRRIATVIVAVVGAVMLWTPAAHAQINAEQVVTIGRNALYFEDYILSIQYFNKAIQAKPFLADPYFFRAVAKLNLEDYQGAEDDASLAIDRNPFIVDAYQVRGVARQNMRKFELAVADYNRGLELMPEDKNLMINRAVCLGELKRYDDALEAYEKLKRIDGKNDRLYLGMAHLRLEQGDTTAALDDINHSIALSHNNASAYAMRSEIAMRQRRDWKAAQADMDSAIILEPRYSGYFVNRAYMKYNQDDYFGAMADYDYAISLDPASIEGHFNRGLLLTEVGESNKAINDFTYVLKSDPDNFMATYNRALLYMRTGQYRKAVADFNTVLKKYPQFEAGYMARGEARRKMGDMKGGNADYDRALAIFKSKKTRVSTFNPAEVEAKEANRRAEQLAQSGELPAETQDEIMNRFNTLLTVPAENPVKPEYANRQRGRIQNANFEIEPEPMFELCYHATDDELRSATYYMREVTEANESGMLPALLSLASGSTRLSEDAINRHFASIEYYNSLLSTSRPRAIDYFARGLDYVIVKNPPAAVADANRAIALSPQMALAYMLRAQAHYLQYQMTLTGVNDEVSPDGGDIKAQTMLHSQQGNELLHAIVADCDSVIALSPSNVYARFNKGNAYMLLNDNTAAISAFTQALAIKPDLGEAYYNRGLMYLRMGNKEKGVADLSKAGELGILPSYNILKRMNN